MKKLLKILSMIIIVLVSVFVIKFYFYKTHSKIKVQIKDVTLSCNLKYRGLKGAVDFVVDEKGTYYIAYKNRIQIIKSDGESYDILKNLSLNIYSMDYYKGNLYYSSDDKVYCYSIEKGENSVLISGMPNYGDYKDSVLKVKGGYIYVSIGAATNSAVVGDDNIWIKNNLYAHDVTPIDLTLKGINFGREKRGAFQSYNTQSVKGQIIPKHFPGNASVIVYDLADGSSETFASGIRNVTGMDFTSDGKFICAIGGMENRGSRPVIGDTDYIYEIKKGVWYGWPDYSGGDPVTSPKFKSIKNSPLQFVLDNHPNANPPAPLYQHKAVGAIGKLTIDTEGVLNQKDSIFFYDKSDSIIYSFRGIGSPMEEIKFNSNSQISNIKIFNRELLALDENEGYLYSISRGKINEHIKASKNIYPYLIFVSVLGVILILKIQIQ
ncbi:hypothetical protein ACJDU8_12310 [Clostridium sp. WILCCON 0269]|uniref:Glucose/Sorbosone dehydrogenase domain-containing protein n=1 Tax=Candidatus Clostridium eludens TaxID=3381663 RepID=A0ABW8SKN5_9CLOT